MMSGGDNVSFSGTGTPPDRQDPKIKKPPPDMTFRFPVDEEARVEKSKLLGVKRRKKYATKDSWRRQVFKNLGDNPTDKEILDAMERVIPEKIDKIELLETQLKEIKERLSMLIMEKKAEEDKWLLNSSTNDEYGVHNFFPTLHHIEYFPALLAAVTPAATETGVVVLRKVDLTFLQPCDLPDGHFERLHFKLLAQHIFSDSSYDGTSEGLQHINVQSSQQEHTLAGAPENLAPLFVQDKFLDLGPEIPGNEDIAMILEGKLEKPLTTHYASDIPVINGLNENSILPVPAPIVQLRNLSGNLLTLFPEGDEDVPGVSTDFGFFGFLGSIIPIHKERRNLHHVNFLSWGATKHWLVVPASEGAKLEDAILRLCKIDSDFKEAECHYFVHHASKYLCPEFLLQNDIKFNTFEQHAEDMVIIFPGAYYQVLSCGPNWAQVINYAQDTPESRAAYFAPEMFTGCTAQTGECGGTVEFNLKIDRLLQRRFQMDHSLAGKIKLVYPS